MAPRETYAPDDGHAPCWHRQQRASVVQHGRYTYGIAVTPTPVVSVLICCWCGQELALESSDAPVPTAHASPASLPQ